MIKKAFAAFAFFLCSLGTAAVCSAAVDYSGIIESESNWIAGLQQSSGAIIMSEQYIATFPDANNQDVDYYVVEPYFANLAVIGMLEHPTAANIAVAKKWVNWYFNHLNAQSGDVPDGSVYRYFIRVSNGQESNNPPGNTYPTSPGYDSTDSYAATFITLLKKLYEVSPADASLLTSNRAKIERIMGAIVATQDTDGLTNAFPAYPIKYVEDNTEVFEGLKNAEWLERNIFGDSAKASTYQGYKNLNLSGIELMWNQANQNYDTYWCNHCADSLSSWSNFYPDAASQVYPIWTGVLSPTDPRSVQLYNKLNVHFPGWPTMTGTGDPFPWAILAYSGALMQDKPNVDTFLATIKNTFIDTNHTDSLYYNLEAGFTIRAAKEIRDQNNVALSRTVTVSSNASTASRVNDGNLTNNWLSAATNNEWIKFDLGAAANLNRAVIKWGTGYATKYKIQVSDDGVTFTDAYTETAGNGATDDVTFGPVTKRYVKISFTARSSSSGLNVSEIELYGNNASNTTNYALNKTATASSLAADAPLSVDGDTTTRWGSSYNNGEYYKVDLGAVKTISKVLLNWEAAYDTAYSIQISTDNVNFTTVYSTTTGDGATDIIRIAPQKARYVKILCTTRATPYGSSFWELGVY